MQYIDDYANTFNFRQYVKLHHQVIKVTEHLVNGQCQWKLLVKNSQTGQLTTELFDAVYVCTGHHGHASMPTFEGQSEFEGKIVHAHDVHSGQGFAGQHVVVVGLGNSGADLAAELGPIAKQVYVALRHGTWVAQRVGPFGLPLDHFFLRRIVSLLLYLLPYFLFCSIFEAYLNFRFDHARYRLKPTSRILSQHITVNDALPNLILSGKVKVCSNIKRFTKSGVIFEGKSKLELQTKMKHSSL